MNSRSKSQKSYKYFITYENDFDSHNPGFEFQNLKDAIRFFNDIIKTGTFWLNDELHKGRHWNVCLWEITNNENKLIKAKKFEFKLNL